jgi:hypothetical protein
LYYPVLPDLSELGFIVLSKLALLVISDCDEILWRGLAGRGGRLGLAGVVVVV